MQTVVVIDNQEPHVATKALEGFSGLMIVVNDLDRARHALLNIRVDLWICDLTIDDLDFRKLHADALTINASARVLLTGPTVSQMLAAKLIREGMASQFIAKPWQPFAIKSLVNALLREPAAASTATRKTPPSKPPQPGAKRLVIAGRHPAPRPRTTNRITLPVSDAGSEGRYRLDEMIGEGGMGRIYRAHDLLLDMEVAVKLLSHEFSRDEEAVGSLKEETRVCLQLLHRHIVRIFNLDKRKEIYFIIMEYVRGSSLYRLLEQSPQGVPPGMVVEIVQVMADALAYAHRKGVLHRDITPGNVLISEDGVLKLIDFGIAARINRQRMVSEYVVGTPVYMSPEQLRGDPLDARTDVYSFGVLVYQMLTRRLPNDPKATVEDLSFRPHPPLVGVPDAVRETLESATAFEVAARWPSVASFASAFADACRQDYALD